MANCIDPKGDTEKCIAGGSERHEPVIAGLVENFEINGADVPVSVVRVLILLLEAADRTFRVAIIWVSVSIKLTVHGITVGDI